MPAARTVLQRLNNLDNYLSGYPQNQQSDRFEELICQAFSALLHLPFFDTSNDDLNKRHRLTWFGTAAPFSRSPHGPDGLARAHNYCLVIEATLKTRSIQWSQEFARCLSHARSVARSEDIDDRDISLVG